LARGGGDSLHLFVVFVILVVFVFFLPSARPRRRFSQQRTAKLVNL